MVAGTASCSTHKQPCQLNLGGGRRSKSSDHDQLHTLVLTPEDPVVPGRQTSIGLNAMARNSLDGHPCR